MKTEAGRRNRSSGDAWPWIGAPVWPLVLLVVALTPAPALAGSPLTLAPKLGASIPSSRLVPSLLAGLELDYALPFWAERLRVAGTLLYAEPHLRSYGQAEPVGVYGYELSQQTLTASVEAAVGIQIDAWLPWAAAGVALTFLRSRLDAFDATRAETAQRLGPIVRAGCDLRLGGGAVFAEVGYSHVTFQLPSTGRTPASAFMSAAGYRFDL